MPYCSMCMPIGWNGLNMPTEGCSVYMPIVITNFKVRGFKQDSVQYMMKVIQLTAQPIANNNQLKALSNPNKWVINLFSISCPKPNSPFYQKDQIMLQH